MLPQGWALARIDELAGASGVVTDGDWVESKDQDAAGEIRLTQLADVGEGDFRDRSSRYMNRETAERLRCTFLQPGDALIARMPDPIGRACLFPGLGQPAVTAVDVMVWRTDGELADADWFVRWVNSPTVRTLMVEGAGGTTRQRIAGGRIKELELPVPPKAEQRRIVAKLDALTARLARARAELDRVPALAGKLRRTILDQAFSGALTAEFRNEQSGEAVLPPKLDDQERGLWTGDVLPSSWQWVTFSDFFADCTDTYRKLPTSEYLADGPFPVVDQGVGQVGGYTDRVELVHPATERVVIFGDHTRCCKLVDPPFVQGADGVKVLAAAIGVDINYARHALVAVAIPAKGYSRHMKFVRRTLWPLAPLPEQRQIVRRIDAAFVRADRLEAEATRARALIDRLEAAILARAFRGELVPQDPADEPASVLLDRIRAQRAAAPIRRRGQRG